MTTHHFTFTMRHSVVGMDSIITVVSLFTFFTSFTLFLSGKIPYWQSLLQFHPHYICLLCCTLKQFRGASLYSLSLYIPWLTTDGMLLHIISSFPFSQPSFKPRFPQSIGNLFGLLSELWASSIKVFRASKWYHSYSALFTSDTLDTLIDIILLPEEQYWFLIFEDISDLSLSTLKQVLLFIPLFFHVTW